eukprot:CAMPEP_0172699158 /NCGR_PEP_ID=MMETSP1074-20121228/29982_1 /TAXON_ID=2916 /ORGANISM="Ceratium fusus, Strain PA161109" /LENGTH=90 /DNA_ID=CAMNT_0013520317 /DNA_START=83 /DNA_END=355 /DNA_ORIENTATION=-
MDMGTKCGFKPGSSVAFGGTSGAGDAEFTSRGNGEVSCSCFSQGKKSNRQFEVCNDKAPGSAARFIGGAQPSSKPLFALLVMAFALSALQ